MSNRILETPLDELSNSVTIEVEPAQDAAAHVIAWMIAVDRDLPQVGDARRLPEIPKHIGTKRRGRALHGRKCAVHLRRPLDVLVHFGGELDCEHPAHGVECAL